MIIFHVTGNFNKTRKLLNKAKNVNIYKILEKYGEEGVRALAEATPKDTGKTAESWSYNIVEGQGEIRLEFSNSNTNHGVPIVILLQYGHATRSGGWVEGRDFINPAIQPVFDKIADKAWKEVTKS